MDFGVDGGWKNPVENPDIQWEGNHQDCPKTACFLVIWGIASFERSPMWHKRTTCLFYSCFVHSHVCSTFHVAFSEAGKKVKQQQSVAICEESSKGDGLGTGVPNVSHLTLRRSPKYKWKKWKKWNARTVHLHCFKLRCQDETGWNMMERFQDLR